MAHNVRRKHAATHRRLRMIHFCSAPVCGGASTLCSEFPVSTQPLQMNRASCLRLLGDVDGPLIEPTVINPRR